MFEMPNKPNRTTPPKVNHGKKLLPSRQRPNTPLRSPSERDREHYQKRGASWR
jgi:hypothetical protein